MHRTILGGLVLLATAACGAETRLGTYGDPDPGAVVSEKAGDAWATTKATLAELRSARFSATLATQRCSKASTSTCDLTTQTIRANGTFSLAPVLLASTLQVTVPATENAGRTTTTAQVRELGGELYSRDASTPGSCWQTWDKTYRSTFEAGFRTGLAVLRSVQVDYDLPSSSSAVQLTGTANALAVVRSLGLLPELDGTYGITPAIRQQLAHKTVSVQITVGAGGSPVSFVVSGKQAAGEIDPGGTAGAISYLSTVERAWTSFTLKDFGAAPDVEAPPADQTLPKGAPASTSCG